MDFDNTSDTELSELGEFGLIKHLTQHIEINHPSTIKGVGDDAAVIDNGNLQTVVTTDMLVEGVHFDLTYVPLRHLGYKSVVVNLSDIYAMNAEPKQIVVSIAISNRFKLGALEELYSGMLMACKKYNVDLVGGDTTSSLTGLVISITAIGTAKKEKIQPTSMIDVSDGLSSEILHLCTESNVGVDLYEEKIPIDPLTYNTAFEFNLDPTLCALSGGEDYELLFTIDIADYEKVKNIKEFTIIGHITNLAKGRTMIAKAGTVHELKAQGWNALLKK